MDTVKLKINGIEVEAPQGSTILEAARLAHIDIPTLCYLKDINAIGACAPTARELDSDLMARSRVFCDNIESILHESGDFLIPLQEGRYGKEHLLGTVGDVLLGSCPGRGSRQEISIFKAVGMAVEDIACAIYLYEQALAAPSN